jgi:16S rRNA (adenine1518-N6/adenine1519-N6)-dimethyltransferase
VEPAREDVTPELLTPTSVRQLLQAHGLHPRKAVGQHFVVDPNTVRKMVRDAQVGPDDVVLEVGPGLGSLTRALAASARRVIAVEIDDSFVALLRDTLGDVAQVEVVHGDALRVDLDEMVGGVDARLIANLPYNVATPIVLRALDAAHIRDVFVTVQREVGQRWAARPGSRVYGGVSAKIALAADARVVATVPRTAFHPVPKVDSVTVHIVRRADAPPLEERRRVAEVIDAAFAQRRKTVRNALRAVYPEHDVDVALDAADVTPSFRAEQLDAATFRALAAVLRGRAGVGPGERR